MAIKSKTRVKVFFALLFIFFLPKLIGAQDGGLYAGSSPHFFQRFSWAESAYTLRYEVVVESIDLGVFREVLREFTEQLFIEVSLPPGRYRFRVIPYDLFNRPGEGTDWEFFEIRLAVNPEPAGFFPEYFRLDTARAEHVLNVFGNNFAFDAEIFLVSLYYGFTIDPAEQEVIFDEDTGRSEARLVFDHAQLIPGYFTVHVRNPGGLEASLLGFIIERREPGPGRLDFYFGAAWMPLFHVQGNGVNYLYGGALRFAMIYSAQRFLNMGLEITASAYFYQNGLRAILAENNLLLQRPFSGGRLAFNLRAGMGIVLSAAEEANAAAPAQDQSPLNESAIFANTGFSFVWLPFANFYIEAGINYTYFFALDNFSGALRPWIGMGLRI